MECPAGSVALPSVSVRTFVEWPRGFATGCEGECGSEGWRLRDTFMDAGARHGEAEVWVRLQVKIAQVGMLRFEYEMACVGEEMRFFVELDGGPPLLLCSAEEGGGGDTWISRCQRDGIR